MRLALLNPDTLLPTEEYSSDRLRVVSEMIRIAGEWTVPILVESSTRVVMDGHHRLASALQARFARVPCLLVNYYTDVRLEAWQDGGPINPQEVVARGLSGQLFPPKSTRHILRREMPAIRPWPLEMLAS